MRRRRIPQSLLDASRRLRREQTPAEKKLWEVLRDRRFEGIRFKRQTVIGTYIADFYCPSRRLIIELDGGIHNQPDVAFNDSVRQTNLEAEHYTVLRFTNDQIEGDIMAVLELIGQYIFLTD